MASTCGKRKDKEEKSGDEGPPPSPCHSLMRQFATYISLVFCFSITTNFSRPSLPLEDSSTNNASDDAQDDEKNFTT